jgi:site-specific DNA-cytosine methylase
MTNDTKIRYFSMFTGVGGFELGIGDKGECIGFSDTQRYKMMGNAVTVNVIMAIMEKLWKQKR